MVHLFRLKYHWLSTKDDFVRHEQGKEIFIKNEKN